MRERAALSDRVDVHVVNQWCWLGTARDEGELGELLETPPRPQFDIDVTRLLLRRIAKGAAEVIPVPRVAAQAAD